MLVLGLLVIFVRPKCFVLIPYHHGYIVVDRPTWAVVGTVLSHSTASHCCQHDMRTGETVDACPGGYFPCLTDQEYETVCAGLATWSCLPVFRRIVQMARAAVALTVILVSASFFLNGGRSAVRLGL